MSRPGGSGSFGGGGSTGRSLRKGGQGELLRVLLDEGGKKGNERGTSSIRITVDW